MIEGDLRPQQLFEEATQEPQLEVFQHALLEAPPGEEVTLDNCLVTAQPLYKKAEDSALWQCSLSALPDIWNPDRNEVVEAVTSNENAKIAQKLRLRPGDRVSLRGIKTGSTLELGNGEQKQLSRVSVTGIEVIYREKRVSKTAFEMDKLI